MSEIQGVESIRYPSCTFNYGNGGKLISIGYEGELYARKSEKDARLEKIGRRTAELESLVRDMYGYATYREMELCSACTNANGDYADCAACDEYDGACGIAKRRFEELYAGRMAALGIDVEGGGE